MKAVNLIPVEERRGGAGTPGRTGQAPYLVLGALALAVVLLAVAALSSRSVADKRDQAASLQQQVAGEKTAADRLQRHVDLGAQRDERTQTVSGLVKARFDWASVLREVARTLPKGASLTTLDGSGGTAASATAATPATGAATAAPTLKVAGCTANQSDVALLLVDLRRMNGVEKVSLDTTAKADRSAGGATDSATGGDCRAGSDQRPQFTMTVTFRAPVAPAATASAATATATTGAATAASGTATKTTTTPSTEAAK